MVGSDRFPGGLLEVIFLGKGFDFVLVRRSILELLGSITPPSHVGDTCRLFEVDLDPTCVGLIGDPAVGVSCDPVVDVLELVNRVAWKCS